jgi:hypothetical protein
MISSQTYNDGWNFNVSYKIFFEKHNDRKNNLKKIS